MWKPEVGYSNGDTNTGYHRYTSVYITVGGRDSSVGIATRYGLDGPGIESRWGWDFNHPSRPPWGPPSLLYNGYRVFPGGKAAGADADPQPPSAEVLNWVQLYLYPP